MGGIFSQYRFSALSPSCFLNGKSLIGKSIYITGLVFSALLTLSSCHTLKKVVVKKPLTEADPENLIPKMDSAQFHCEWMSAKISASSTNDGKNNSFSASMRIRKDSIIWVSISSLGIEVARIFITKDSLKLVNRLDSKYALSAFTKINTTLQLSLDFDMLQALIFGNYFSYLDEKKLRSSYVDDDLYILSTLRRRKLKRAMEEKELNKRIIQDVWIDPKSFRVRKMAVDDNKLNRKMIAQYEYAIPDDSTQINETTGFPKKISISIESEKPMQIIMEITKVTLNKEQEFPFSIPEKYERMK